MCSQITFHAPREKYESKLISGYSIFYYGQLINTNRTTKVLNGEKIYNHQTNM